MRPRDNHEVEHVGGVAELPGGQGRPPTLQYQLLDRLATHERLVEGQQLVEEHPEAEAVHFLCVFLQQQTNIKSNNQALCTLFLYKKPNGLLCFDKMPQEVVGFSRGFSRL